MVHAFFLAVVLIALTASCSPMTKQPENEARSREIQTPYRATPKRAAQIRDNYKRIKVGMSPSEVKAILSEPDEVHPLYEPQIKNPKTIGRTWWYYIKKTDDRRTDDSYVRVSFDLNDIVTTIDGL